MSGLIVFLNERSPDWLALMIAIAWQSSLLVLLTVGAARLLRRASPVIRYWLWQLVAIKLLLMPLWTHNIPVPWLPLASSPVPVLIQHEAAHTDAAVVAQETQAQQAAAAAPTQTRTQTTPAVAPARPALTWSSALLVSWAAIIALQLAQLTAQRWRLARLLQSGESAPLQTIAIAAQAARDLGLRRVPSLVVVDANCSPFACGILRPRIVLPRTLLTELDDAELRQTLAHELAHVARADLAWIWPGHFARMVYFFNPLVHVVAGRIRLERELACDQWVVARAGHAPAEYMQTLIHVVTHMSQSPQEAVS